jgi:hypothetical protein
VPIGAEASLSRANLPPPEALAVLSRPVSRGQGVTLATSGSPQLTSTVQSVPATAYGVGGRMFDHDWSTALLRGFGHEGVRGAGGVPDRVRCLHQHRQVASEVATDARTSHTVASGGQMAVPFV